MLISIIPYNTQTYKYIKYVIVDSEFIEPFIYVPKVNLTIGYMESIIITYFEKELNVALNLKRCLDIIRRGTTAYHNKSTLTRRCETAFRDLAIYYKDSTKAPPLSEYAACTMQYIKQLVWLGQLK